ncbi:MAG: hypothetical protein Greene041619_1110, partial [Candidatus Peregrinibacteria bacterium Greene0416_19]
EGDGISLQSPTREFEHPDGENPQTRTTGSRLAPKKLVDIARESDPVKKVLGVIGMLHSSQDYERVLDYAGLIEGQMSEEACQRIRIIVEDANAAKDAAQKGKDHAVLPSPPHGSIPRERVEQMEALGLDAGSVYRDIFLVMRMNSAARDVQGPKAGIFPHHLFPREMLEDALRAREKAGINDGIARRLRTLVPELRKIEEEAEAGDTQGSPAGP